jgi:hypothetical protein
VTDSHAKPPPGPRVQEFLREVARMIAERMVAEDEQRRQPKAPAREKDTG